MVKIWLENERRVLLTRFLDSDMVKDSKRTDIGEFWRRKTYVKEYDLLKPQLEREFPEPYQVATMYCDGTWNDYNAPFIVQIPQCNLDCVWCYVPKHMRQAHKVKNAAEIGEYFTPEEIIAMWCANADAGILRISGGEPFLAPEFLIELGHVFKEAFEPANYWRRFLWLDTNLLGRSYEKVIGTLSRLMIPFGVCGCFKGFDRYQFQMNMGYDLDPLLRQGDSPFNRQLRNARTILDSITTVRGELFFYIPEVIQHMREDQIRDLIRFFIGRLVTEVHKFAPLRTTVLYIKEYESNKGTMPGRVPSGTTKRLWNEFLLANYPKELLWLPQYQIPMQGGDGE